MSQRYDEENETLWIKSLATADDLVPNDEIQEWITALKRGQAPDGRSIRHVNYVFEESGAAEYNHQALRFARLGTFVGNLDDNEPYDSDDGVSFEPREDFGIE